MSSIKTRKHYVIADAGFSAVWAAFYFLAFAYMSFCWSKTPFTYDFAQANALGSILFSLLSAAAWVSQALSCNRARSVFIEQMQIG